MEAKQVIIVRKDLNMRKGKMCAQASHGSLGAVLKTINKKEVLFNGTHNWTLSFKENSPMANWLLGRFTKIVVGVDSEAELLEIYNKAQEELKDIPSVLITDAGLTEFDGVPTHTVVAIGPGNPEDIDKITGHLKLL